MMGVGRDASKGLDFKGVAHSYGHQQVLSDISFHIDPGEILCLLGPSGCGKTTSLRLVAGLEDLQQGEIALGGDVIAIPGEAVPTEARGVGYVIQDFALFPHLNVFDNVAFGLKGQSKAKAKETVEDLLASVGLGGRDSAYPHQLSGGEQQRVALARAFAPKPQILLLDEPFSSLDVLIRKDLRLVTRDLVRSRHIPALLVTHDPLEAAQMGDHIAVMQNGHIIQYGDLDQLKNAPASEFVRELFAAPA